MYVCMYVRTYVFTNICTPPTHTHTRHADSYPPIEQHTESAPSPWLPVVYIRDPVVRVRDVGPSFPIAGNVDVPACNQTAILLLLHATEYRWLAFDDSSAIGPREPWASGDGDGRSMQWRCERHAYFRPSRMPRGNAATTWR